MKYVNELWKKLYIKKRIINFNGFSLVPIFFKTRIHKWIMGEIIKKKGS